MHNLAVMTTTSFYKTNARIPAAVGDYIHDMVTLKAIFQGMEYGDLSDVLGQNYSTCLIS